MIKKSSKGFTLIELLVVVSIIGVLATIIVSTLNDARARARRVQVVVQIDQLRKSLELYNLDNGHYPNRENGNIAWNTIASNGYRIGGGPYRQHNYLEWGEFRTKLLPYMDINNLEDALNKDGLYFDFTYVPVKCHVLDRCSNCNEGTNFQRYTINFRKIRSQPIINEYFYRNSGNWWSWHCLDSN